MNTKLIIIATVAALSLATTAFAQGEPGSAQRSATPTASFAASTPLNVIGSHQR